MEALVLLLVVWVVLIPAGVTLSLLALTALSRRRQVALAPQAPVVPLAHARSATRKVA